jgi:signal peptidase I
MLPTLRVGQVVRLRSISVHDRIDRGEIILFKPPAGSDPNIEDVKRVIGLPNETVSAKGRVYVDGKALAESYLPKGTMTSDLAPVTVPPDDYWLMGDNRGNSKDSRVFGPIRRAAIIGVVDSP